MWKGDLDTARLSPDGSSGVGDSPLGIQTAGIFSGHVALEKNADSVVVVGAQHAFQQEFQLLPRDHFP